MANETPKEAEPISAQSQADSNSGTNQNNGIMAENNHNSGTIQQNLFNINSDMMLGGAGVLVFAVFAYKALQLLKDKKSKK